jgi:hypothetical protein
MEARKVPVGANSLASLASSVGLRNAEAVMICEVKDQT